MEVGAARRFLTSFVGREVEVHDLARAVRSHRLVTAVGAGGIGKTRVAVAAAEAVALEFDGCVMVELAELADPTLVGHVIAGQFGLPTTTDAFDPSALIALIGDRSILLLLDNCEHLLDSTAALVADLLGACANLRVLATSRQALGVPGEAIYRVPAMIATDAIALFADRAALTTCLEASDFASTPAVAELCVILEGIPLGIELCSRYVRQFPPSALVDLVRSRMVRLEAHGMASRTTSLEMCIEWSYELCTPLEQVVWIGLSVFIGPFSLEAALFAFADERAEADVIGAIAGLVDKSILTCDPSEPHAPYRMLEVLRQFGADRANESGTAQLMQVRHRDYYLGLAHEFERTWIGSRQLEWMTRFKAEHANIRAAFEFSIGSPEEAPKAMQMARILQLYFVAYGSGGEALHWVQLALKHATGTPEERAFALCVGCFIGSLLQQLETAAILYEELSALADSHRSDRVESYRLYAGAVVAAYSGDANKGAELAEQGIELMTRLDDINSLVHLQFLSGLILSYAGRREAASAAYRACFALTDPRGEDFFRTYALWSMGLDELFDGRPDRALAMEREALAIKEAFSDQLCIALALEAIGLIFSRTAGVGDHGRQAALFLGASDAIFTNIGVHSEAIPYASQWRRDGIRATLEAIPQEQYDGYFALGRTLDQHETIAIALGNSRLPPIALSAALTPREREIAALVATGATNREVAARLVVSTRTVESHVERILRKLNVRSRTEVAGALQHTDS